MNPPAPINQTPSNNARGIRNNNPGNLRVAPNASGTDGSFAIFDKAEDGIAAMSRQLQLYGDRGNNTPYGIIHTYAPSSENNSQAYLNAVTQETGFKAHESLDLGDPQVLKRMMSSMIRHDNGAQPYSEKQIDSGINASMTERRWQGLRDTNRLANQRDQYSDWLLNATNNLEISSSAKNQISPLNNIVPPEVSPQSPVLVMKDDGWNGVSINQKTSVDEANINASTKETAVNSIPHVDVQKLTDAIASALQEKDSKLEVTFINGQTGSRHKARGHGGKVTVAMPMS